MRLLFCHPLWRRKARSILNAEWVSVNDSSSLDVPDFCSCSFVFPRSWVQAWPSQWQDPGPTGHGWNTILWHVTIQDYKIRAWSTKSIALIWGLSMMSNGSDAMLELPMKIMVITIIIIKKVKSSSYSKIVSILKFYAHWLELITVILLTLGEFPPKIW